MALIAVVPATARAGAPTGQGPDAAPIEVVAAQRHDVSSRLRDLTPVVRDRATQREVPLLPTSAAQGGTRSGDGALQTTVLPDVGTTPGLNFAGVGNGDYGFTPNAAPPDTNGAAGLTQYVQWVNESFAVFNKSTGALLYGPAAGNTLWSGFGGSCQTDNDGDPIAQYDKAANRWVLTQFAVPRGGPYFQCIAVSTTSDATGSYFRYAFQLPQFPDYPKLAVWPDAYYMSFNMFRGGRTFTGARACALDRSKMLSGAPATAVCAQLSSSFASLLPSDLDGATPPPAGSPDYYLNFGTNSLNVWKFHVDFVTTANSTFTGPTNIPVATFSAACGGGTCIPQLGTSNTLDSLGDRLMYRLAYRNFGDHESLVVDHSVAAGSSTGIRWYEIRTPRTTPTIFQQGTFAPDAAYRWMGSIAMDHVGDIAVGYSVSSSSINPSIRYSGRVPTDPLGMLEAENSILTGGGSQTGTLSRWGDYSAMSIDPVDDCTFYYTTEYLKASGSFNWSTRIASFKFPGCDRPTVASPAAANPNPVTGTTTTLSVLGADDAGEATLTYSWSASGPGPVSFSPNGTNAAKTSTATFSQVGSYTLTATITDAAGLSATSSVAVSVTQTLSAIAVSPASASTALNGTQQFTAAARDQFGASMAATVSWSVTGGGTIDPSGLFTAGSTAGGPFTVSATSGAVSGTAQVSVIDAPPTVASGASANPNPVTGTTTSLSVLGADDAGEATLTYSWSASGPGPVSFSPNGTNAAKTSTATFSQVGSYTLTATITDAAGLSATSSVAVSVTQTLSAIAVSPASATVPAGGAQQQYSAAATDQFGTAMTATFTWAVDDPDGTIDSTGLFTSGVTPGTFTVTATSGGVTGTASVTVF